MMKKYKLIFADSEVMKEDWLFYFIDYDTKKEICICNDSEKLKNFYKLCVNNNIILVFYNGRQYDQWIFKAILKDLNPYRVSQGLIEQGKKGYQLIPKHYEIPLIFFDCMTSFNGLKTLESFLGLDIRETNVDFNLDRKMTKEELQDTIDYCRKDVLATIEVFEKSKDEFESMMGLIEMFDLPLINITKTKAQISATILEAQRPDFKRDDEWDIVLPDNLIIENYTDVVDWFLSDEIQKPKAKYEREVARVKHIFALGGIHGSTVKQRYEGIIACWDVASLYPSTIIEYDLMSRNVKNANKYREIRDLRIDLKKKGDPKQAPLKIVLNSTYGILNDKYSPMYDPRQARRVCIYNQLFLLDLVEKIESVCGDKAELLQNNTDGTYWKFEDMKTLELAKKEVEKWEKRTRYTMELDMAQLLIQRDVNTYLLVTSKGKIKCKGALKQPKPLDNDLPIIPKALKEYLVNGTPLEDYINNENRLIEFAKTYKVTGNYKCAYHNGIELPHKTYRVFASTNVNDTEFFKWKKDKETPDKFANTPQHTFYENGDIRDKTIDNYPLDKEWYINQAIKEYKKITGKDYK